MEQIQKQKIPKQREPQPVDDMPEVIDETVLDVSTERILGNIALALA